ncbi:MAG: efflux RND transporter periplasmic adaptor subunit [Bryobacteraceae bacterium]
MRILKIASATMSLALIVGGCGSKPEAAAPVPQAAPVRVKVAPAAHVEWPDFYTVTGTVHAQTSAQISAQVMAYVREVHAKAGDHVRAGQTLIVLDAREVQARVRQSEAAQNEARAGAAEAEQGIGSARANLELAETTFRRMKELFDKKSLSSQEFDEAGARVRVARANLEMAQSRRKQLDAKIAQTQEDRLAAQVQSGYASLTAPFAAVVTARNVEPGNLVVPGTPLLTIEQDGAFRLEAGVEESRLSGVRLGQRVDVILDSLEQPLAGTISEIVPAVDPSSRSFVVKIGLPASSVVRSGLFGRARFTFGKRNVIAAPLSAVVDRGQMKWVFAADNGVARARIVTLGERFGDQVEVLSGISPPEMLIAPVPAGLADGARIEVRQ